jgi:hypothetical protein
VGANFVSFSPIFFPHPQERVKEHPEYGKMLKRMCEGDLSPEDKKRINTKVIGHDGLELQSMLKGK